MAFSLPNVEFSSVTWSSAESATEPGNAARYGSVSISFTVQGPEDPNYTLSSAVTYWLPEDTPNYLVAYQRCYEYLKNSMNLSPDQLDQLEQWNQHIVQEINSVCEKAGLPAPDLNANDWSINAPFFDEYATKTGSYQGVFSLALGDVPTPGPESGF